MRVDFYWISKPRFRQAPLEVVCRLAHKAFQSDQIALVLCADADQATLLDDLMWSFSADSFLPHQIAGQDDDELSPILLVPPGHRTTLRPLVFNLRDQAVPDGPERVIELIPDAEAARVAARARWRDYLGRGHKPQKVEI